MTAQKLRYGDPCLSYQLQVVPSPDVLNEILDARRAWTGDPTGLVEIPAPSLHLTVFSPVDVFTAVEQGRQIWTASEAIWRAELRRLTAEESCAAVAFTEIKAMGSAVVLFAPAFGALRELRARLYAACAATTAKWRVPDIAHISLFRAETAFSPSKNWPLQRPIRLPIDELRLLRETAYPSLSTELIEIFPLQR